MVVAWEKVETEAASRVVAATAVVERASAGWVVGVMVVVAREEAETEEAASRAAATTAVAERASAGWRVAVMVVVAQEKAETEEAASRAAAAMAVAVTEEVSREAIEEREMVADEAVVATTAAVAEARIHTMHTCLGFARTDSWSLTEKANC